jgi:hypothetical protein
MFREDPAREILQTRYVHTLAVWLKVAPPASSMILCDPWKQVQPILRIVTEGRTWWTLQAGDTVALIKNDRRQEHIVEAIELHRVTPSRFTGYRVSTAMNWSCGFEDGIPQPR